MQHAAWYLRGDERDVKRKLQVAQAAVNERRAALEASRQQEAAMPVLIVDRPFQGERWPNVRTRTLQDHSRRGDRTGSVAGEDGGPGHRTRMEIA